MPEFTDENSSYQEDERILRCSDEDEAHHNAFYYAVRSGNIKLLDTLISKWTDNLEELDVILSRAYGELLLKNVALSPKIEMYVERKLIDLRFFSNSSGSLVDDLNNIKLRIEFVLQNMSSLKRDYSGIEKVDGKFLFIAKSIAQSIHILKRQIKSTYDRLPWEELEFCIVIFVSCHRKPRELNLFYRAILSKSKILNYIEHFANKLEDEKGNLKTDKLRCFPKKKRREIVLEIISSYPQFELLYHDYQQIRDIYSLQKIGNQIKLALSADPRKKEGQLVITRVLQVIGEHLKDTLESPKLSPITSEHLVLLLPRKARQIVINLRDSISHADSLSKRIEIEERTDANFFINIQNDTKTVGSAITDIFYKNKIKAIGIVLKKIVDSENSDEIREVLEELSTVKLDDAMPEVCKTMEHENVEKLIKKLSDITADKTNYQKELFKRINRIINWGGTRPQNIISDYIGAFTSLRNLSIALGNNKMDDNLIKLIKFNANHALKKITSARESDDLKAIAELSIKIAVTIDDRPDEVSMLLSEIVYIAEFRTGGIKWMEELLEKLKEKETRDDGYTYNATKDLYYSNQLALKLSELKEILTRSAESEKCQAVVEILLLDIMSILDSRLENNEFCFDDNTPLLNGRCLRNHLAHDNAIVDVLLPNPSRSVILNAEKLVQKNIMGSKKKIGNLISDDSVQLKEKYDRDLVIVTNQKRMFAALEVGDLKSLKDCLREGADVKARSIHSWTTLHFAAKGPGLDVVKFILDQDLSMHVTDNDGQTPLHVAAAHGRQDIVDYFINISGIYVNNVNNRGKTPLHVAAQNGHEDTVEVLLQNEAIQDSGGFSPLDYAIRNNHFGVAKLLLTKSKNDINAAMGTSATLFQASKHGQLELVNFLLENKADVNAKTDQDMTPLHTAAYNGHLEIAKTLILHGANVNAKNAVDHTPLHCAVGSGNIEVINVLVEYGANINATDGTYKNTPLHYAVMDGHVNIVKALLENKADANVANIEGNTPLHFAVHLEIVAVLLDRGVDINAKSGDNSTALHHAAAQGHREIAALLIKNGAEINAKGNNNLTALHGAAFEGRVDVAKLLIESNAEVNARDSRGHTPLHTASMNGSKDVIDLLIRNKAEVNASANYGPAPLHLAVLKGHKDIVRHFIKHKAEVDMRGIEDGTLLLAAIQQGHAEIVQMLVTNGANVNAKSPNPLLFAVRYNRKEIVEVLIANGADVTVEGAEALSTAVVRGYSDIVDILLRRKVEVNKGDFQQLTPLHLAAKMGYKKIVNALIRKRADVNAVGINNVTPLWFAVQEGHEKIVDILLARGANVNFKSDREATPLHLAVNGGHKEIVNALIASGADVNAVGTVKNVAPLWLAAVVGYEDIAEILLAGGANADCRSDEGYTPLHIAATEGHSNVVKILLDNKANINITDNKNRTSVELAVGHGHLHVVKILLQCRKIDMEKRYGDYDFTLLHIAAQDTNVELVKYLVDEGCNINARDSGGDKPIHLAAGKCIKDNVEFFLNMGISVNDPGAFNLTVLHSAVMNGHLETVNYLIVQGADINAKDATGLTPMHIAVSLGYKDVIALLASTENLFKAVKRNNSSDVQKCLKAGASANAKSAEGVVPLHYAGWKGYDEVVDVLLRNKADPNVVGKKGLTPLHYAAKFSHLKVVKVLLSHYAVYDAVSDDGKTPSDFTVDDSIINLFKLVTDSFEGVENNDCQIIRDLNKIKDIDTVKAIMGARNKENKTLVVAAMFGNFSKVEELKGVLQGDISTQINKALVCLNLGQYLQALSILKSAFEKRKEILGSDNPGTLDIQSRMAKVLHAQGAYREALDAYEGILQKQKEILGENDKNTLNTRRAIASTLYRQGKDVEALSIFQAVDRKQKEILGPDHSDTLDTQYRMALVLDRQGKYQEALNIYRTVYEKRRKTLDGNNLTAAVLAQNNIAMVLAIHGNYEKAFEIYKDVFEKKKVVLRYVRTLHNIAEILFKQKNHPEALKAHREVLNVQRKALVPNHPDTLNTRYSIGTVLFAQGEWFEALRSYREVFDEMKAVFGPNHPSVLDIAKKMERINLMYHLQNGIHFAASNGDILTVRRLLKDGADVDEKDFDGLTPLHYAIINGHLDVVIVLLENGADPTRVTNRGTTSLHTAASKGDKKIVEVLLRHVSHDKLNEFVDAKTTDSGTTSLQLAVENGFLDVTKSLLERGAIYDIRNTEGKTPLDLATNENVKNLLKLIEELFRDAKNSDDKIIGKMIAVPHDEFLAVTNARNNQGNTILDLGFEFLAAPKE